MTVSADLGFVSNYKKVILLGSAASGKSALVERFLGGGFSPEYRQTLGADLFLKTAADNKRYSLQIWSCGGHERYRALLEQFFADVALVCFDLLSASSFQEVPFWYNEVKRLAPDASIILVGTKSDEPEAMAIKVQDAMKYAKEWGIDFKTVSCKSNNNVDSLLEQISTIVV